LIEERAVKLTRTYLLALMTFLVPVAALAQQVTFTNSDGTFTSDGNAVGTTTLSLGAGKLTAISGLTGFGIANNSAIYPNCAPTCLGSISLTTGTLASGSLLTSTAATPATFNAGGSFTVSYTDGVSFTGTFQAGAAWISTGKNTWTFSGSIVDGMLTVGGNTYIIAQAATVQLTTTGDAPVITKNSKGVITGITFKDSGGTTNFMAPVPEPGTLSLFGGGLIAIGMLARRKLRSETKVDSATQ
jgi:PEP-CTERM motif